MRLKHGFVIIRYSLLTCTAFALHFPSPNTPPATVVQSQLEALAELDLPTAFHLFSRYRRLQIEEASRRDAPDLSVEIADARTNNVECNDVYDKMRNILLDACPDLVGHTRSEIVSALPLGGEDGRLKRWRCKVKVRRRFEREYLFTLTQQTSGSCEYELASDSWAEFDECPVFEGCWLVNEIVLDGGVGEEVREMAVA